MKTKEIKVTPNTHPLSLWHKTATKRAFGTNSHVPGEIKSRSVKIHTLTGAISQTCLGNPKLKWGGCLAFGLIWMSDLISTVDSNGRRYLIEKGKVPGCSVGILSSINLAKKCNNIWRNDVRSDSFNKGVNLPLRLMAFFHVTKVFLQKNCQNSIWRKK